jgi:hypothetical protein
MIREACSCGAEFESDLPNQEELVKNWRRTHKHAVKPDSRDSSTVRNTDIAIGFQALYDQYNDDND